MAKLESASARYIAKFVVIGGGIAGVSCAEQLSFLSPRAEIVLVSSSQLIKAVTNFKKVSRTLEEFNVQETTSRHLTRTSPNVQVIHSVVIGIDPVNHVVKLSTGVSLPYDKICVCTGAVPKLITRDHPCVLGIRDTESVQEFKTKLADSRRIVVVGNGGIATELVFEVSGCEVVWAIKDPSIGSTFFDEGAATFFLPHLCTPHHSHAAKSDCSKEKDVVKAMPMKRMKYMLDPLSQEKTETASMIATVSDSATDQCESVACQHEMGPEDVLKIGAKASRLPSSVGSALGPDWSADLAIRGSSKEWYYRNVHIEYVCEVITVLTREQASAAGYRLEPFSDASQSSAADDHFPVYVLLSNGKVFGCDIVVSATGVTPNTNFLSDLPELRLASDGGVAVDTEMRTSLLDVYAAGDVCTVDWPHCSTWFQMRLWSQARQMGSYAAKCMVMHTAGEPVSLDFCFELFSHLTKFFGYKVVLLGRYNGQGLGQDHEIILRCTKGIEYVKVLLQAGRMVGAVLIGDTDLEETFENLILNQMDLSRFGEALLDPNIDIEDYFD